MYHPYPNDFVKNEIKTSFNEINLLPLFKIIESCMSDVVIIVNKEKMVSYVSPSITIMMGYSQDEYQGELALEVIHPDDKDKVSTLHERSLITGDPFTVEYRAKHKNGEWKVIESKVVPISYKPSTLDFVLIVARDVTDRKKAQELEGKFEKLMVAGQLARGFAHHIRNPLTSVKGFLKLLEPEIMNKDVINILFDEIYNIEEIVNDYLVLGNPSLNLRENCNVNKILLDAIESLNEEASRFNVEFKLFLKTSISNVMGDAIYLKLVFLNLLQNAIDSMQGGGDITITTHKDNSSHLCIDISDQGCGIDEEIISRLGEPLYILKQKGTGIGIMLCHRIVYDHKGIIEYKSIKGVGTTVMIRLPLSF